MNKEKDCNITRNIFKHAIEYLKTRPNRYKTKRLIKLRNLDEADHKLRFNLLKASKTH